VGAVFEGKDRFLKALTIYKKYRVAEENIKDNKAKGD